MPSLTVNKTTLFTVLLMIAILVVLGLLVMQTTLHIDIVSLFLHHHTAKLADDIGYGGY